MNLTIFIPTKNRYYFIKKILHYYTYIKFSGDLIILDSSDLEIKKKNINEVKKNNSLNIKYLHDTGLPCGLMKKFIDHVKTDYVVFSGDDDYFVKDGMIKCINFLDTNSNFIGCTGEGISIHSSKDKKKIDFILDYNQAKIIGSNSKERLNAQFKKYKVPIFSIYRQNYFKKFLDPVPNVDELSLVCPDKAIADEYIIEAAMVAYGNIEHLHMPYLVRHIHSGRNIGNLVPDFKRDWIKSPNYEKSVDYFYDKISQIISQIENDDLIHSKEFIKKIFDYHVDYELKKEKKNVIKLFLSKIFIYIPILKDFRYFLIKNYISKKKYHTTYLTRGYDLIIKSIEGNL